METSKELLLGRLEHERTNSGHKYLLVKERDGKFYCGVWVCKEVRAHYFREDPDEAYTNHFTEVVGELISEGKVVQYKHLIPSPKDPAASEVYGLAGKEENFGH